MLLDEQDNLVRCCYDHDNYHHAEPNIHVLYLSRLNTSPGARSRLYTFTVCSQDRLRLERDMYANYHALCLGVHQLNPDYCLKTEHAFVVGITDNSICSVPRMFPPSWMVRV